MTRAQGKKGLIVTIIALAVTLLVVGGIAIAQNLNKSTPAADTSTEITEPEKEVKPEETETETEPEIDPGTSTPTVDPATLATIDIEPLEITVSYTKGTGAFEFAVLRAADGTKYVEFSNPDLIGTKCTNDAGVFASIIRSPSSPEDKTLISETVEVDGTTYGLSLAGTACTSDVALLEKYQTGFKNGFSQLKAME